MLNDKLDKHYLQMVEPPSIISMTMTSRCNLKCVMCDHGIREVQKEDFEADLVNQVGTFIPKASLVDLTGLGEPLLSDLFWNILESYPVEESEPESQYFLTFNSNGTLLNSTNIAKIISSRVKKIRISIDSPNKDLYKKIRGFSLEKVVTGLRNLINERNSMNRQFPKLAVEMTLMKENISSVFEMIDLCKDIGADFLELWSLNEQPENTLDSWIVQKGSWEFNYRKQLLSNFSPVELKKIVENFHAYADQKKMPITSWIQGELRESQNFLNLKQYIPENSNIYIPWKNDSIRCFLPWTELRITYNGEVHPCCWSPHPIGDLKTETLESIWNNEAIQEMRADLIEGNVPYLCSGAACPYLQGKRRLPILEWNASINDSMEMGVLPIDYENVTGFFPLEEYDGHSLRWTDGNTKISIQLSRAIPPRSLIVKAWNLSASETPVQITANDVLIFNAPLPFEGLDESFSLPPLDGQDKLVIKINSEVFQAEGDTRKLGIAIKNLILSDIETLVLPTQFHGELSSLQEVTQKGKEPLEPSHSFIFTMRNILKRLFGWQ